MILFTFPYAGGHSLAYRFMEPYFGPEIQVIHLEPPGRGKRAKESLLHSMEAIVDDVYSQIESRIKEEEYVFFGHSMGALVAYLVFQKAQHEGTRLPHHLFLSGKEAPSVKHASINTVDPKYNQPKEEFWEYIDSLGALPPEIKQHKDLIDYVEPIVRADIQALETYLYVPPEDPAQLPITVFYGLDDSETTVDKLMPWKLETNGPFTMIPFEGEHFFIVDHVELITKIILKSVKEYVC